jgi:hypothetical protein
MLTKADYLRFSARKKEQNEKKKKCFLFTRRGAFDSVDSTHLYTVVPSLGCD